MVPVQKRFRGDRLKLARFIFPLAIVLVLTAVVYSVLRPALVRGKARRVLKELNCVDARYVPFLSIRTSKREAWYWDAVDRVFGPTHGQIHSFALNECPAILDDRDLAFLRSLPELEKLEVPFQNLSDAFLADVVGNAENLRDLDLAGTFAGEKTVEALLERPKSLHRVHLVGTNITRKDAERLKAVFSDTLSWSPPLPAADRAKWQALHPAVPVFTFESDFDLPLYLQIYLDRLEPEQKKTLGAVTGRFNCVTFSEGQLSSPFARSILRGKQTPNFSFNGVELIDSTWMGSLAHIEELSFYETTIHLPPPVAGRCVPARIENLRMTPSEKAIGDGGIGRLFQGSRVDHAHLSKSGWNQVDMAFFDDFDQVDFRQLSISWDKSIHKLLPPLARNRHIEVLDVSIQRVDGAGLALIGQMTQLKKLDVRGTEISGGDLAAIGSLTNLIELDIGVNVIRDRHLKHLLPLQNLEVLSLQSHHGRPGYKVLTDACLPTLAGFPKLRVLNVEASDIHDVAGILALPALEVLHENNFSEAERARIRKARPGLVFQ